MRAPDQWTAGDYAISTRQSPVSFFRVVRVELVPGEPWPVLVPAWCCSRCEELEDLLGGRRVDSFWFRHAKRREIRKFSGVSFCIFRNTPRLEARVGPCARALRFAVLSASSASSRRR